MDDLRTWILLLTVCICGLMLKGLMCEEIVRVVDGDTAYSGRLEVLINGQWGTVCSRMWSEADARVACKQLGYPKGGKGIRYAAFGSGEGLPVLMSHVSCRGNETSLMKCRYRGGSSCTHDEDAGVVCEDDAAKQQTGDIRLVDGPTSTSGRVEIEYYGVWGTVCRDGWDLAQSRVVCKELGFCGGSSVMHENGAFGDGSGPVWLSEVNCTGHEDRLQQCHHPGWGENSCEHHSDVGVVCQACQTGYMRLIGGATSTAGIVSISREGIWGTICSDTWSDKEARVVCRQLEYTDGLPANNNNFTMAQGPTWLSGVACTGYETHLLGCYHDDSENGGWGNNDCRHYQDVAVECFMSTIYTTTKVPSSSHVTSTVRRTTTTPSGGLTTTKPTEGTTDAGPGVNLPKDNTVLVIVCVVVLSLVVIVVVVVIVFGVTKIKTTRAKHSILFTQRGRQNEYRVSGDFTEGACAQASIQMPSRSTSRQPRDSGIYQEIGDKEPCGEPQRPPGRRSNAYVDNPRGHRPSTGLIGVPLPAIPNAENGRHLNDTDNHRGALSSQGADGAVGIDTEQDHYAQISDNTDNSDYLMPLKLKY